jgi:hypothetical protein
MPSKNDTKGEKPKRKMIMFTIEMKKELTTKWESGTCLSDVAAQYGITK